MQRLLDFKKFSLLEGPLKFFCLRHKVTDNQQQLAVDAWYASMTVNGGWPRKAATLCPHQTALTCLPEQNGPHCQYVGSDLEKVGSDGLIKVD